MSLFDLYIFSVVFSLGILLVMNDEAKKKGEKPLPLFASLMGPFVIGITFGTMVYNLEKIASKNETGDK